MAKQNYKNMTIDKLRTEVLNLLKKKNINNLNRSIELASKEVLIEILKHPQMTASGIIWTLGDEA